MSALTTALPPLAASQPTPAAAPPAAEATKTATSRRTAWLQASRRSIPAARLVAIVDALVATTALVAMQERNASVRTDSWLSITVSLADLAAVVVYAVTVVVVFEIAGLYEAALVRRWRDECYRVIGATAAIAALMFATTDAPGVANWSGTFRLWGITAAALVAARAIRSRVTRSATGCRRALIVGTGPHALRMCRELSTDPLTAYQVVGFVDTVETPRSPYLRRRTIGTLDELEAILVSEHVDEVHVGLPVKSHYRQIQETIRACERIGVKVLYGADIFGTELARPRIGAAGISPRIELQVVAEGPAVFVKRLFDVAAAAALIVICSPLMLATALAIRLTSEGPIIFAQERYGLNRRRFRMLKFRTMVPNAEQLQASLESLNEVKGAAFKIANDPRVTPLGRVLRRTSIDELPQLFNVLRGDMSLIGPRPLPNRDVSRFERTAHMRRFSVRPGLTGLWQVSGRSRLAFDEWIRLDLHYIDNWSLLLDFRILARTPAAVIRGTGAA